jgi:hypothetical protein
MGTSSSIPVVKGDLDGRKKNLVLDWVEKEILDVMESLHDRARGNGESLRDIQSSSREGSTFSTNRK